MISKHKIVSHDVEGDLFGVVVLAQGPKGKSQKIFHILEVINDNDSSWYMNKFVALAGVSMNPKGLISKTVEDIGNFPGQKENPMKVFELFPEEFLWKWQISKKDKGLDFTL